MGLDGSCGILLSVVRLQLSVVVSLAVMRVNLRVHLLRRLLHPVGGLAVHPSSLASLAVLSCGFCRASTSGLVFFVSSGR